MLIWRFTLQQTHRVIHQPVSVVLQCSLNAWLNGLVNGDQRRLTRSGSALEACSQRYAIHLHVYFTFNTCRFDTLITPLYGNGNASTQCVRLLSPPRTNPMSFRYRAMLCIARIVLSQDVCPSICLSITRRYCVEYTKHVIKFVHYWVATQHSSFSVANSRLTAIF